MSVQIPSTTVPTRLANSDTERRSANFHPSIWGHQFLSYYPDSAEKHNKIEHQKLKEKVKRMLMGIGDDEVSQKLQFIDAIQRLGVSYHFESEIDTILRDINSSFQKDSDGSNMDDDLYIISLRFRVLRGQGYKVSCDVFNKFKDNQGNFKDILISDVRGMLSLYEATHFSVRGDEILDEALAFSASHLDSISSQLGSPLSAQITHALKQPIRKGIPRLEARQYFTVYQEDALCNKTLLNFAKLDFNMLQKLHQKELSDIARWWKELDFANKLSFARDRVVECYFWILGVYFEPEYILARKILTKVIAMTSVLDDIYDVYGTPEELELLTAAIERWDEAPGDELPEYMKIYYKALVDVFVEIEEILVNDNRLYRLPYAKEAMKRQARVYLLESKWLLRDEVPTMEEYLSVAVMSSGYPLLATISFVGMGDIVTKESLDWLSGGPKIVTASATIARLMDDIVSHKFEQKRGHVASAIECYMKQYGVTEKEATNELKKQVVEAWKHINEECHLPTAVPMSLLTPILNLARVMDVIYKEEDSYTNVGSVLKYFVSSLLIDPAPL